MAHYVNRNGYWSLEASYRDPVTGKPRKRYLRYYGKRRPDDPQARYEQMIATAERKGAEMDEAQRAKYGETNAERREREETAARFSQEKFLEETKSTVPAAPSEPQDSPAHSESTDSPDVSTPDPGSDDASADAEPSSEGEGS